MKSVEPDQILCSVASVLGLHCLPVSILIEARHKWVKGMDTLTREAISKLFLPPF